MNKEERYQKISEEIVKAVGGMDNIAGSAHCATRLRIVLKDNDKADMEQLDNIDLCKGTFVAGDQLQMIFGAGLVNDVYDVFSKYTHTENMSLTDIKEAGAKKHNPLQIAIKSLSDVFIEIMPGILAAALLLGLTGVLNNLEFVQNNATLYAINRLVTIASAGIFDVLALAVCYSATRRCGGKPIPGIVMGAIMLSANLTNAYDAAQGLATPETLSLFGVSIELVGFQGGIIIALMMGHVTAKLDQFFDKKIPDAVKLLVSPLLTVLLSTLLLFTIVGPVRRTLSSWITTGLIWTTENLGVLGYMLFAGVQQIIVITGLHHIFGAIEAQLIADTGTNFLNPLMSVALMGQGGAVLGYLLLHWNNVRDREICIPSFLSTLFGISEPAIFGVNLRHKFPLIAGCLASAVSGAYVYLTHLTALGFGTTALPGLAIANPANNGYVNYIIAHLIALGLGILFTVLIGRFSKSEKEKKAQEKKLKEIPAVKAEPNVVYSPVKGKAAFITECSDPVFNQKSMGDGMVFIPEEELIVSPVNGTVMMVFPTKHAIGIRTEEGTELLIHMGLNTVSLEGRPFELYVGEGDTVKAGQKIARMDLKAIEAEGLSTETPVVITSMQPVTVQNTGTVNWGDSVMTITRKD
ncbi:PTS beta-glucoside transporter subunit IIBCA [Faecalibaculum rodentium]|uniref:PTS beta-glucoside transporter subunit IIBCA n=1 Tax=Faecalibaculum rodentium TaxID=1702221 RepID=UPI0026F310ED|nr:PTS transporter subunit IIBCA [Faecalibaculum rodentium]